MKNIFWYAGLSLISIVIAAVTIYRKKSDYKVSSLIVFFFFIAGFAWICEFAVLGLLDAYQYKTDVFDDIWAQNLLGHLLLNSTLYPTFAVVTVTSRRRISAIVFIVAIVVPIEFLFIRLGIYEMHWWRHPMTIITVVVILALSIIWFDKIKHGCIGRARALTFFFVAIFMVHFPAPILLLLGKQHYQLGPIDQFFANGILSSTVITFTYHMLESIELVLITCILKKRCLKILPFLVSIASQCVFSALHVYVAEDGWRLIYTLIIYETFLGAFMLVEKHTLKPVAAQI